MNSTNSPRKTVNPILVVLASLIPSFMYSVAHAIDTHSMDHSGHSMTSGQHISSQHGDQTQHGKHVDHVQHGNHGKHEDHAQHGNHATHGDHTHHDNHAEHGQHQNHAASHSGDEHAMHRKMMNKKGYVRTIENYTIPNVTLLTMHNESVSLKDVLTTDKPLLVNFIFHLN